LVLYPSFGGNPGVGHLSLVASCSQVLVEMIVMGEMSALKEGIVKPL
jgi:hypothetical protein